MESSRTLNPARFYLDMSKSNYATMLYYTCDPPRWKEAGRQNEESLEREPANFNALWCKCQLYTKQMVYRTVKDTLPLLGSVLEDPVAVTTAKAELGALYADLGPAFYQKSRTLLEEAIREMESMYLKDDGVMKMRLVKWKFDLVRTYNRLMNKGCIRTYWDPSLEVTPSHADMFKRIRILVEDIQSGGDPGFCGAGWVELGDAYKKYEENVPDELRTDVLPDKKTTNDCFDKAIQHAPDDVFVLERCGRHWRQRASDVDGFEKAVRLLEKCVRMDPLRDVAFHHLGLAHRSIWLEKEGHEEARLHNNAVKKYGKKSQKRNYRNPNKTRSNSYRSDAEMVEIYPHNDVPTLSSNPVLNACDSGAMAGTHPGRSFSRSASHNTSSLQNCDTDSAHTPTFKKMHSSPARISQTLAPRYPKTPSEVPRHYRRPDYFDILRAGNPLAKDRDHQDLLSARKYFETANKIRQGKSPRYLIDLARTYLSTDNTSTARELFLRARNTDYNSNDGAYLFEQFGLMEEKQVERYSTGVDGEDGDDVDHPDVEEVKNLYRQAIRCSADGKERSRIAFYHLRDILNRQIQDCSAPSEILQEEHLLLYTTIQDAKKAVQIVENMKNNETKMWHLVHLFHERNRREDHEAAFTYLALLADAEKLKANLTEDDSIGLYTRMETVIEIGEKRTKMNPDRIKETLLKIYTWLVALNDNNKTQENDKKPSRKICLLAPSSATPGTETVERVLSDVIGTEYVRAYLEDSPDILAGTVTHEAIEDMIKNSTVAIVNMQTMDNVVNELELMMQTMVKNFLSHPDYHPKRICQVVSNRSTRVPMGCFDDTLNRWDLGDDNQADIEYPKYQTNLAFSLLRALFLTESN